MDEKNKKTSLISPAGIGDIVKREKSKDLTVNNVQQNLDCYRNGA